MRNKEYKIDNTVYRLQSLTRGQVRTVSSIENLQDQADELVKLSITDIDVDDIDMADYQTLVEEIISFNGLDQDSVSKKK